MFKLIHKILEKLSEILFPEQCIGCRKEGEVFCKKCRLRSKASHRGKTSLPFVSKVFSWGLYRDKVLREVLRRFKYHGTYGLSHPLSEMLHELIKPHISSSTENILLLPIPMTLQKKRIRGYNQAELMAQSLAKKISIPHSSKILLKIKNTPSQTELEGFERILNIKDSFAVSKPEEVKNKKILLVDDISTTGATLSEAARVLKEAGAREVMGLVVAK
jgi:ComF family protein